MFEINKVYKHDRCLDTCIRIRKVTETDDHYNMVVDWHNFRYNMMIIQLLDPIKVKKSDINFWKEFPALEVLNG
jgi:hypothetical protein